MKVGWVDPKVTRDPSVLGAGSGRLYVKKNLSDPLEYRVGFGQRLLISGRPENPTTNPLEGSVRGLAPSESERSTAPRSLQELGSLGPPFRCSIGHQPDLLPDDERKSFLRSWTWNNRPTTLQII
ncbi:hypothetical protein PGTUg99_016192 [Puccinia graminis f. sp. tritici]|uniref:Uncharacterized protein n=1 Tax=Puccinia graminis f. sp. tritici TaxID=56615 RepID=A0A5B0RFQ9_PUCGR|nr:hypothetical protein PGTUg99_016192 [Puccinia graminis f. sp. tritici]